MAGSVNPRPLKSNSVEWAYQRVRPEIQALVARVEPINLDVMHVVTRCLAVSHTVQFLRVEAAQLPFFDVTTFDRLPVYTRALLHLHTMPGRGRTPKAEVRSLAERVAHLRGCLLAELNAARKRGVTVNRRCDFGGNRSYLESASDLLSLSLLFRKEWSNFEGKCGVSISELDEGEALGEALYYALGSRNRPKEAAAARAHERAQAFTLVVRTYEELRRAVSFLRWSERDVLVPSLYAGRCKRRRKEEMPSDTAVEPSCGSRNPDTPGAPPVPVPAP